MEIIRSRKYGLKYWALLEAIEPAAWVLYRITAEQLQASVSRTRLPL